MPIDSLVDTLKLFDEPSMDVMQVSKLPSLSRPLKTIDGRSFAPQLRGEPGNPREWMHCFYCPRPERTPAKQFVRDKRWKLYRDGTFFDVANDV